MLIGSKSSGSQEVEGGPFYRWSDLSCHKGRSCTISETFCEHGTFDFVKKKKKENPVGLAAFHFLDMAHHLRSTYPRCRLLTGQTGSSYFSLSQVGLVVVLSHCAWACTGTACRLSKISAALTPRATRAVVCFLDALLSALCGLCEPCT